MIKIILFIFLCITACISLAAEDYYHFSTPVQAERFSSLTSQLRCLVCQNETIAESNSALANDLREVVYQKIKTGESDPEIITYLTHRYGNYILYRPPFNLSTLMLWLAPCLILIISLIYFVFFIKKHKQ